MVESLSTKNTELTALTNKLQQTIVELEATQEVQEELDQSQRQEIDRLRKSNDHLLVGIQTIETEKGDLYRKISDFKLKNERAVKSVPSLPPPPFLLYLVPHVHQNNRRTSKRNSNSSYTGPTTSVSLSVSL
jgi:deoxyribodipyrimidine photolyase